MKIERLHAENFRNLEILDFSPVDGVNIICGNNAQGKTNILEAIWLFTGARSFRGAKDPELITAGRKNAVIKCRYTSGGVSEESGIRFGAEKKVTIGGAVLESRAKLSGSFCATVFSPDYLDIVKSGPALRRKFLDGAICELWPRHASLLTEYSTILIERNSLLKDMPYHSELFDTLPVWDRKIAETGAAITYARLRYLKKLAPRASEIYLGMAGKSGGTETLGLKYRFSDGRYTEGGEKASDICEELLDLLKTGLNEDINLGYTRSGPHRDDMEILIENMPARIYASQGQQRSAVLSLKLAEAEVLANGIGEPPVLLLDDVMSELDSSRQDYLLNNIKGSQVFITCCDPEGLKKYKTGAVFRVKGGRIIN